MLSEDTGTQGKGNFELEMGYDWSRQEGSRQFLFQPQLSWGANAALDLIVQPSWVVNIAPDGQRTRGLGDTNLDFKWRFYGAAPWSLGIRAGLEVPTAENDLGLPSNHYASHAILVLTGDYTPLTLDANLGYTRDPALPGVRTNLYHFSAAATYAVNNRVFFILDASLDSNPDSAQVDHQEVLLGGFIYTARPGLDLDVGFRSRVGAVGPAQQWLFGLTWRGAP